VPADGVKDRPKTMSDMEANHDEPQPKDFDREAIRKKFHLQEK
jgi:hypothetical protein